MLNDRDDKYENPEESEYHFSDEEVNYEVETESPKPASTQKENIFNRLTRSKRMLISLAVFLVLVFVVYKMVSPSSPVSTDVTNPVIVAQSSSPIKDLPVTPRPIQQPSVLPVGAANTMSSTAAPTVTTTVTSPVIVPQPAASVPQAGQAPQPSATQATPAAPSQPESVAQPQLPNMSIAPQTAAQTVNNNSPPVSIQTTTTTSIPSTSVPPVAQSTALTNMGSQLPQNIDVRVSALASENEKLASQLQQEYVQKINDYASQNKALQDQVQTLNTRVASMEVQMNQLIQALTRQTQSVPAAPPPAISEHADVKAPYNVQAIIPGRAWLRSDNGETLTVAEGDMVKDVGRVTKIDPYDGVVEINTGSKVISLSYGNGT